MIDSSFAVDNILHKLLDNSTRIIYDPSNTLFDIIINNMGMGVFYDGYPSTHHYAYDAYVSNNFLKHSTNKNNILPLYHLHDILFIHEPLSSNFKKEDKVLINNNLKNTYKILLHPSLADSWSCLDEKSIIPYGIETPRLDISKTRNDILIMNLKKSHQLNLIYQHIKNIFPTTVMITDIPDNWDTIYNTISSYKVIIEENSILNQLISAYCGCVIVTPNINFDPNIVGYFNIDNFSSIINNMQSILSSYDNINFTKQMDYIKNTYPMDSFKNSIRDIIQIIKKKVFIL